MSVSREAFSITYVNGLIYVIGGISAGFGTLKHCEVYNPQTDEWTTLCELKERCC